MTCLSLFLDRAKFLARLWKRANGIRRNYQREVQRCSTSIPHGQLVSTPFSALPLPSLPLLSRCLRKSFTALVDMLDFSSGRKTPDVEDSLLFAESARTFARPFFK
jgi:hypothetical protein